MKSIALPRSSQCAVALVAIKQDTAERWCCAMQHHVSRDGCLTCAAQADATRAPLACQRCCATGALRWAVLHGAARAKGKQQRRIIFHQSAYMIDPNLACKIACDCLPLFGRTRICSAANITYSSGRSFACALHFRTPLSHDVSGRILSLLEATFLRADNSATHNGPHLNSAAAPNCVPASPSRVRE